MEEGQGLVGRARPVEEEEEGRGLCRRGRGVACVGGGGAWPVEEGEGAWSADEGYKAIALD